MEFDVITMGLILLYFPVIRFLVRAAEKEEKYVTIRYYYNTVFFALFSFFACISLHQNVDYLSGLRFNSFAFWIGLLGLFFIAFVFMKVIREVFFSFRSLFRMEEQSRTLHNIVSNVIRIILVFTVAYFLICLFDPDAFRGLVDITSPLSTYWDLFYFSIVTFATVGYGDIVPVSPLAKFAVASQIVLFYVVIGTGFVYAAKKK